MEEDKQILAELINNGNIQYDIKDELSNISRGIGELSDVAKEPAKDIEIPDTVTVSNLPEVQSVEVVNPTEVDLSALERTMEGLGGTVEKMLASITKKKDDTVATLLAKILHYFEKKKAKSDEKILSTLQEINEKEILPYELPQEIISKEKRIKVEVDRVGSGSSISKDGFDFGKYTAITMTYVAAGNGVGEIETVVYKNGAETIATLTLAYDVSNNLATVTKS